MVEWMAAYLAGYLDANAVTVPDPDQEPEYLALFRVLTATLLNDAWPASLPKELGPYKALIESRGQPAQFAEALVAVADLRMARQCGYAQVDDARPRGPYAAPSLMSKFAFIAMPAELWAIRAIVQKVDGYTVSLVADHPWLQAGFAQPPASLPNATDCDIVRALRRYLLTVAASASASHTAD